jgi:hypothetical protein
MSPEKQRSVLFGHAKQKIFYEHQDNSHHHDLYEEDYQVSAENTSLSFLSGEENLDREFEEIEIDEDVGEQNLRVVGVGEVG